MRIKKKFVLGNLFAVFSFMLVIWLFKDSEKNVIIEGRSYLQNGGPEAVGLIGKLFPRQFIRRLNTCFSTLGSYKITADFTMNMIYDHMKLSKSYLGLQSSLDDSKLDLPDRIVKSKVKPPAFEEPLEVIVIPHSHNDPGWKKTYMKYFLDQTTHILSLMVDKLTQYPDMTFIWVETCFLHTWWANQTVATRDKFRELVQSGRIEIVSGMWVAPDEASPHYFALLDQMIEGHYWVKKHLNVVPESSLNFDQFGYSVSMPYLVKKAGLKHVLIKRVHRGVKQIFGEKNWMNFHWRQFWDPAGKDDIFSLIDTYEWMSISDSCGPDRSVCRGLDFLYMKDLPKPGSSEAMKPMRADFATGKQANNLDDFVGTVVDQFRLKAANYKTNVMMLPHGGDFRFDKAEDWDRQYRNLKLFMNYVNERKSKYNVNMRFGTLKDYFEVVKKQTTKYHLEYPVVSGDFFTYTENDEYWTGYFTTRQFDKRLSREVLESLRAAELVAFVVLQDKAADNLSKALTDRILQRLAEARQDLAIFQHHDAITGTAQAHVAVDYEKRLASALVATQQVLSEGLSYILHDGQYNRNQGSMAPTISHEFHDKLTQRVVVPVNDEGTKLVLFNSLTQKRSEIVTIAVSRRDIQVFDHLDNLVPSDIVDPEDASGRYNLMLNVNFPPVSVLAYTLRIADGDTSKKGGEDRLSNVALSHVCENNFMNVTFSRETGSPVQVCYKKRGFCSSLRIDWVQYIGNGGAYSMRSFGKEQPAEQSPPHVSFTRGTTFCRVQAAFKLVRATYTLPLTDGISGRALRVNVRTDLTSVANNFNGDLAMRLATHVQNNETFYVDSNSFQMLGRRFRTNIPFDGNVYPMSSMAFIEDARRRLVVHSAQPHGVVSRTSGIIDFMLDRTGPIPEMDMPEAVRDSKPTEMIFFLEFDNTVVMEKTGTSEIAVPSLQSMHLNDALQHPIYKFYNLESRTLQPFVTLLQQEISCDLIIANIKNLLNEKGEYDGTSMTLFRRGVACQTGKTNDYLCSVADSVQLTPGDLIGRANRKSSRYVKEVSLSHLFDGKTLFMDDSVTIEPMDIKTFHIKQNAH